MASSFLVQIVALVFIVVMTSNVSAQDGLDPDSQDIELEPIIPTEDEPEIASANSDHKELTPIELAVGVDMRQRSFTVDSVAANLQLSSSLYPTIFVGGAVFPHLDIQWLESLGLTGNFNYGVDTTIINEAGIVRRVPTRHLEVELMLSYRHRVSEKIALQAGTGIMTLDFVLSDNPFYSSTTYRAWKLSVSGLYSALDWLDVSGGVDIFPLVGLGVSESEFGQDSSTLGASIIVAFVADIIAGLYVYGGYEMLAFSSNFTGRGARGLESAVTTDIFHSLSLRAGYRF